MSDVKPSSRKERASATRGRILAAAYALFSERGYAATTMPDVATALSQAAARIQQVGGN